MKKHKKSVELAQPEQDSPLRTVPEAAQFLRVSQSLIWKLLRTGELKARRLGKRVMFSKEYLREFAERQC